MNIELYSYSVMASILGIVIVFLSLVGLCLLMVLLKKVFAEREKPSDSAAAAPSAKAAPAASAEAPEWIMAAVAAYMLEADIPVPSAAAWNPGIGDIPSLWMSQPAFAIKAGR